MFGFGKLRFKGVDKKHISDPEHIADYEAAEPSEEAIDKMLLALSARPYRRMIAIGGGSVMDTAKALVIDDA